LLHPEAVDHALELEFKDKKRLIEFFAKARERFPNSVRTDDRIFSNEDRVISQWTLTATMAESFLGHAMQVPISVRGASIVQVEHGRISQWSDDYDPTKSRRYSIAGWFTEWIEL
jgi:hypothetical protein